MGVCKCACVCLSVCKREGERLWGWREWGGGGRGVCVCVCVREKERDCVWGGGEGVGVCVSECVCVGGWGGVCVCVCTCRPVYLNTHVWEVRRGRRTRTQPFNTTESHLWPVAGRPHSKQTPLTLTAVPGPPTRPCPRSCRTTPGSRTWTLPVPQTAPPRSPASTERLGTAAYPVRAVCLDVYI